MDRFNKNDPEELRIKMTISPKNLSFGIFIISIASLMTELSLMRVFDVLFYPSIAYMIITSALFGYGLAGVYSVIKPLPEDEPVHKSVGALAIFLAIGLVAILPVMNTLPFDVNKFSSEALKQLAYFSGMYVSLILPFFISGRIITHLFSEYAGKIQVLYFWDLIGAAIGSVIIIPLLPWIGPGGVLIVSAALSLIASAIFIQKIKWSMIAGIISLVLIAIPILYYPKYIDFIEHQGKRGVKLAREQGNIEVTKWDPISKIDVINYNTFRYIAYDGGSQNSIFYPFDGDYESLRDNLPQVLSKQFWQRGVLASHFLKEGSEPTVLIIGSAGGQEIKAALMYGARRVIGIEMVGAVVRLGENEYSNYIGNLFHHPSVSVHIDEGRSFLRASDDTFDIIQMFSNHTSSSIAAGTGAVATNYLQTSDAYREYFSHLDENGILHINHYYYPKMVTTAAQAWEQLGNKDFYRHVIVYEYDGDDTLPTLLIKMQPWTSSEVEKLNQFFSAHIPGDAGKYSLVVDPTDIENSSLPLEYFSGELSPELIESTEFRLEPATDDRPYFNLLLKSLNPFSNGLTEFVQDPFKSIPMGLLTIYITGIVALGYSVVFIFIPLILSNTGKQKWSHKSYSLIYFSCLGAGFIIIEFVFVQLFMRIIGSPLYTYSSVIFILLFGAGIGSLTSSYLNITPRYRWYLPFIGILLTISLLLVVYPIVSNFILSSSVPVRIGVSLLLMFPVGFFLGMPFPLGILSLEKQPKGAIAWAWGMNGLFTLIGSLLGVLISINWGFRTTTLFASGIYILAFLTFRKSVIDN